MNWIALSHLASTAALVGLIWTIQMVHYPAFKFVAESNWERFHSFHARSITLIVFPLMLCELIFSLIILAAIYGIQPSWNALHVPSPPAIYSIIYAIPTAQWLLTLIIFVPIHHRLATANLIHRSALMRRLVALNWLRTALWTLEFGLLLSWLLSQEK